MEKEIIIFPVHFKTPYHYLSVADFVEFSQDIEVIIHSINKLLFDWKNNINVLILPPEEGSFLKKIGIIAWTTWAVILGISELLDTEIAKAYIKWLTWHEPTYYAQIAWENTKEMLILKEATGWFLEKDTLELERLWLQRDKLKPAFRAKNRFYETCLNNKDIQAIWFTTDETFPIERENFWTKLANIIDSKDDSIPPTYKLHELIIISPVNTRDSSAQWHAKDKISKKSLSFYLKDQDFFENFLAGKYPLKESESDDILIALIEYQKKEIDWEIKIIARNAVKIYSLNEKQISPIPDDLTVEIIRDKKNKTEGQMTFFE